MTSEKPLKINIITLFPQIFEAYLKVLPLKRAIEKGLVEINLVNLRDFGEGSYKTVDDKTYGGGTGMILMVEPIYKALETIKDKEKVVLLSPRGKRFDQQQAQKLAKCKNITFICGRYEGVDSRVEEYLATEVISLGEFILSGGEIAASAIIESIVRLIPGVLEKEEAVEIESFSDDSSTLEYPQYTRPENFKGMKVPQVLLSGNHIEIQKWRKAHTKKQPQTCDCCN